LLNERTTVHGGPQQPGPGPGALWYKTPCAGKPGPGKPSSAMDIAHLVQSSVAPVFLLSGVAATLGVLTSRLSRIVDRARALEAKLASHPGSAPPLHADLKVLARRAHYINVAISLCTIAA